MEVKNNWKAWIYLLPALILLVVFVIYPFINVFVLSFKENYELVNQSYSGIGIGNYTYVFEDSNFIQAMKNTLLIVLIAVPVSNLLSLLISIALNAIKPLRNVFEVIFFLPYVTNILAIGLVFVMMFDNGTAATSLFNSIIGLFGMDSISFINGSYLAKMTLLIVFIIWTMLPIQIIVLTGAMQNLKKEYYQAAKVDGASKLKQFKNITIPLIRPTLIFSLIISLIWAFRIYTEVVAIFGSGEALLNSGMQTLVGYICIHLSGLPQTSLGYAAVAGIVLTIIIVLIAIINIVLVKKRLTVRRY